MVENPSIKQSRRGFSLARILDYVNSGLHQSRYSRWVAAFLSGVVLSFAASPYNFYPVIFICFPLMLILSDKAARRTKNHGLRSVFAIGWWVGFGYFVTGLSWIAVSFQNQSNIPAELAPFAVIALSGFLALFTALVFIIPPLVKATGFIRLLIFAASWVILEIIRSTILTGFPWLLVGTMWSDFLALAQSVRWIGIFGLSFLTVITALTPLALYELLKKSHYNRLDMVKALVAPILMLIFILSGYYRIYTHPTVYNTDITLRIVQANIPQKEKWNPRLLDDHFAKHLKMSKGSVNSLDPLRGVDLLIWPEVSVPDWDFDRGQNLKRYMISRLLEPGSFALVGGRRYEEQEMNDFQAYNSLFVVNSEGAIVTKYDKMHLVPFGEYTPLKNVLKSLGMIQLAGRRGFVAGENRPVINLPDIPAFVSLICYEIVFPGQVREIPDTNYKVEWLLNITNDAWFGNTKGPHQHLAQTRMRAIEEALPIVRSAVTGISAIIDPIGRITGSIGLGHSGVLMGNLPISTFDKNLISVPIKTLFIFILMNSIVFITLLNRKYSKE